MHLHEFHARRLLYDLGVPSPAGRVAESPGEAEAAFLDLAPGEALVKAQVHLPSRREAGFVRRCSHAHEVRAAAEEFLGGSSRSQAGRAPARFARRVLVVEAVEVIREIYVRARVEPASGATVVELLGERPGASEGASPLASEEFEQATGLRPFQARKLAAAAAAGGPHRAELCRVLAALSGALARLDAECIELHPLALVEGGRVLALDIRLNVDDRALFRRPELSELADHSQEDFRVIRARRSALGYVPLDGDVACAGTGIELAAAAADAVALAGGSPGCLLDLRESAGPTQIAEGFRILSGESALRSVLVWFFAPRARSETAERSMRTALEAVSAELPVVVRLSGSGSEEAGRLFSGIAPPVRLCRTLGEAAAWAVRGDEGVAAGGRP